MTTAHTIESVFALIKPPRPGARQNARTAAPPFELRRGETLALPANRQVTVVRGEVWLTHRGDWHDHFPQGGDSFDTSAHSDSVIQALADSTILIQ